MKDPIPFFVVDRPMSLELLRYCEIDKQEGVFGLMGHANTSERFQELFGEFKGNNIIKMADSGVFSKEGCKLNYEELFSIYERMKTEYGIMIDFLKDKKRTIKSARKAMKIYKKKRYSFKLVGVAQGNTTKEYLECYDTLKSIGFNHIAIGGLLKKNVNSVRYVRVKDENFLKEVLEEIRSKHKNDWLFLLGCYHPKRYNLFKEFEVFGGDYKGWILNYKTPETWINKLNKDLELLESEIIENEKLEELLEKRREITQNLRTDRDLRQEKQNKRFELDKKILNIRESIAKRVKGKYLSNVRTFEKFLCMDKETKRKYRFNQIKAYMDRNIFSLFRDYLLVIESSKIKTNVSNPAPAIELYNDPIYQTIRKMDKEGSLPKNIQILIISTKYGLLGAYDLIEKYNPKISKKRAEKLKKGITKKFTLFLENKNFRKVFISTGKDYTSLLENVNFGCEVIKVPYRSIVEKLLEIERQN